MPPAVEEILTHLEDETSRRWEDLEQELEDDLGFDEEDIFVRMYAGDDEFNRSVPNDKFGTKWFYTRGQGVLPVHAGGGLNLIRMIERNVKALSYDRELEEETQDMVEETVRSIHDNHDGSGQESEDIINAAALEGHVGVPAEEVDEEAEDRYLENQSKDGYRMNDSGDIVYDPEQELRRRYDRDKDAVEALQESFESLFELFKSFKALRFFYISALEEAAGDHDGYEALRDGEVDEEEIFDRLEARYGWGDKVNEFTRRYADLIETRLVEYREELEDMGYRKESQIDNKLHHSHQRFF